MGCEKPFFLHYVWFVSAGMNSMHTASHTCFFNSSWYIYRTSLILPYCTHWRWHSWPAAVILSPHCPPVLPGEWGWCLAAWLHWCRRRTPAVWSQCPFGSFWQQYGVACSHSEMKEVKLLGWASADWVVNVSFYVFYCYMQCIKQVR